MWRRKWRTKLFLIRRPIKWRAKKSAYASQCCEKCAYPYTKTLPRIRIRRIRSDTPFFGSNDFFIEKTIFCKTENWKYIFKILKYIKKILKNITPCIRLQDSPNFAYPYSCVCVFFTTQTQATQNFAVPTRPPKSKKTTLGKSPFFRSVQTSVQNLRFSKHELHIISKRGNLDICKLSSFLILLYASIFDIEWNWQFLKNYEILYKKGSTFLASLYNYFIYYFINVYIYYGIK